MNETSGAARNIAIGVVVFFGTALAFLLGLGCYAAYTAVVG